MKDTFFSILCIILSSPEVEMLCQWNSVLTGVLNFNGHAINDGFIYIPFQCESNNSGAFDVF